MTSTATKTYLVGVIERAIAYYKVEAEDARTAAENWSDGEFHDRDDEVLDSEGACNVRVKQPDGSWAKLPSTEWEAGPPAAVTALLASLEAILPYAENEAYSLEKLKDSPEGEAEAERAWKAVEAAQAAVAQATDTAGPRPAMKQHRLNGKRCPRCFSTGPFLLGSTEKVTVLLDGTLDIADGEWGLDIDCDCPICGFAGRLEDFCEWVELSGQECEQAVEALRTAGNTTEAAAAEEPAAGHTPGPWQQSWQFIVAADPAGVHPDIYLAEIAEEDSDERIASPEQQEANGRLIVAAPELLAACRLVVARWERGDLAEAARGCKAAITLATDGRPPWNVTDAASAGGNPYAVLLLYPDYVNDSGTETYYAFVQASDPLDAVALAQRQAVADQAGSEINPDDFVPLLVTPGHPVSEPLFNK